jgi:DMSO reductase anchor subunit
VLPEKMIFIPLLILAGSASFFHLGRKLRAWRSVANLKNSPLSREVAAFIFFTFVTIVNTFLRMPSLLIVSLVIGLFLLALIDSVYIYSDKSKSVILHSGQTFISALLIGSFFSGIILPFVFIALIKLTLSIYGFKSGKILITYFGIRFLRIAFLIISGFSLISKISYPEHSVYLIFLTGELLDRILFYIDFNPMNIKILLEDRLKIERDEKKRC